MKGFTAYAETVSVYGTEPVFMDGDDTDVYKRQTVTQMAQVYDNDADYANMINVFTVLVCIATMPLMVMAYEIILK